MAEYLVDIKNERLSFFTPAGEVKALNDVSIHLKEGEVLGIVGESGSGKSVTAYSLMGLTAHPGKLLGGNLNFNGHQIENMSEKEMRGIRGNEISIIFQDPMTSLNPVYTVGNQIMEAIRYHTDKSKAQAKERARELLELDRRAEEHVYMAALNGKGRLLGLSLISKGTVNASLIAPREIFIRALLVGASQILLMHNHPAGSITPSREDIKMTEQIKKAGELIGVELADHIIIAANGGGYLSFREEGLLQPSK